MTGKPARPVTGRYSKNYFSTHQRKLDIAPFWVLDRFFREGVRETLNYPSRLEDADVDFVSYTEPYLNTPGHFRNALIGILASLTKQEAVRRSERVKAGMARAKAEGKRISRPALLKAKQEQSKKLAAQDVFKGEHGDFFALYHQRTPAGIWNAVHAGPTRF